MSFFTFALHCLDSIADAINEWFPTSTSPKSRDRQYEALPQRNVLVSLLHILHHLLNTFSILEPNQSRFSSTNVIRTLKPLVKSLIPSFDSSINPLPTPRNIAISHLLLLSLLPLVDSRSIHSNTPTISLLSPCLLLSNHAFGDPVTRIKVLDYLPSFPRQPDPPHHLVRARDLTKNSNSLPLSTILIALNLSFYLFSRNHRNSFDLPPLPVKDNTLQSHHQ